MSRNRERQQELQPGRVDYARTRLEALGYPVTEVNATTLQFIFRGPRLHYTRIPVGLPGAPLPMDGELRTY